VAAPSARGTSTDAGHAAPRPAGPGEALAAALDRVGDRWSLLLVDALLDGPRRFGELGEAVPGIAPNILSDRLRRLEGAGLVRSAPYSTRPPRVEYGLTVAGRELAGVIRLLADWGARQAGEAPGIAVPRHDTCGTPLEARWWCPTCEGPADGVDAEGIVRL
jgi:DNA-binding HxlR family transcriptional regulator